jgi:hypothetical protein
MFASSAFGTSRIHLNGQQRLPQMPGEAEKRLKLLKAHALAELRHK